MTLDAITAISPIDGRYANKTKALSNYFSEYALIKYRLIVEIQWFIALCDNKEISELPSLSLDEKNFLVKIIDDFCPEQAKVVKEFEKTTNHDVKAVEYFIKEKLKKHPRLANHLEYIHFACTSEDINNIAYALMLKDAVEQYILPQFEQLSANLQDLANNFKAQSLLAHTHGQPASPTSLGKELINFCSRFDRQIRQLQQQSYLAKINGAVGNYNAHVICYPEINWPEFAQRFVESLDLTFNAYTTQIEPHDFIAELCHKLIRLNTIALDYSRDVWTYISMGYFKQKLVAGEVGSSTMPHKVNPIDFENAEGNIGIANALLQHFATKLPVSRLQRDLSDSTVLRNLGVALAHSYLANQSLLKGNSKLAIAIDRIDNDLNENWAILGEAIQTIMRRYGIEQPYEKLKAFTRGQDITPQSLSEFIDELELPDNVSAKLKSLTPEDYTGLATLLTKNYQTKSTA